MTVPDNSPNILVYHCITAPIATDPEVAGEAEEWTRDYITKSRYYVADNGVALRCAHPLFSQVIGFACAELILEGTQFALHDLRMAVGNELQCLRLAREAHAKRARFLLFYSPWAWLPKFLYARSLALHAIDGTSPAPLVGRVIDLADVVALGGIVGAPPLHLAIAAQGLGKILPPLSTDALEKMIASGNHGPIWQDLATSLWAVSALYARTHLGHNYSVAAASLPGAHVLPPSSDL